MFNIDKKFYLIFNIEKRKNKCKECEFFLIAYLLLTILI